MKQYFLSISMKQQMIVSWFDLNQPADDESEQPADEHQTATTSQHHRKKPKLSSNSRMQILMQLCGFGKSDK